MGPCIYDQYSPCEYCGKCREKYRKNEETDPDYEYERRRDGDFEEEKDGEAGWQY